MKTSLLLCLAAEGLTICAAALLAPSYAYPPMKAMSGADARAAAPLMRAVDILADESAYEAAVQLTSTNGGITVILYTSERCKACQTMKPRLARLASGYPADVTFFDITFEHGANKELFKRVGVQRLPHVQLAARGEAVESFLCPLSKFDLIEEKLHALAKSVNPQLLHLKQHEGWLSGRRWRAWHSRQQ